MKPRVAESSGRPGDRNTSYTMGGTVSRARPLSDWRCRVICSFLHCPHSPPRVCWPQAHWRCRRPRRTPEKDGVNAETARSGSRALTRQSSAPRGGCARLKNSLSHQIRTRPRRRNNVSLRGPCICSTNGQISRNILILTLNDIRFAALRCVSGFLSYGRVPRGEDQTQVVLRESARDIDRRSPSSGIGTWRLG